MSALVLPGGPTPTSVDPGVGDVANRQSEATSRLPLWRRPGWPLAAIFVPFPLWWATGLTELIVLAMAVPMLVFLVRQRELEVPRGFGWWILFLLWVLVGVFVLRVDAFGAVPDNSTTRLLTFAYRLAQYVAVTVALLYVVNTRDRLSTLQISRTVACLFITVTAGGLLGVVAPYFEFSSLMELVLPGSLTRIPFVRSIVHPSAAQLQVVLGFEAPRPSAPFAFTNTWGLVFAVTLPFFLRCWLGREAGRRRWFAGPVLLAAAIPGVYSLNRGMWGALLAMGLFVAIRAALTRRPGPLLAVTAGLGVLAMVVALSPLGNLVMLRFSNEGSEVGRTNLGSLAVESVAKTSPLIGLGSTRNVQGNFNSISGGATAECPRCSPPALGTQGQLWLVVFSQGLLGLLFFLAFFLTTFMRHVRLRTPTVTMSLCVMVGWLITFPVYNSGGVGLLVVMVAVGLLCREGWQNGAAVRNGSAHHEVPTPLARYSTSLRSGALVLLSLAILGASSGLVLSALRPGDFSATASVLLPESQINESAAYPNASLDTEAQSVMGGAVRDAVARATGMSDESLRGALDVTAIPNTRVVRIRLDSPTETQASAGAGAAAREVLELRSRTLEEQRRAALLPLRAREATLTSGAYALSRTIGERRRGFTMNDTDARTSLQRQLRNALLAQSELVREEIVRVSSLALGGGRVVSEPAATRSGDSLRVNLISGLTLGLGLAGVFVVVVGPRLRRVSDIRVAAGLPVLATVDRTTAASTAVSRMLESRGVTYLCVDDGDGDAVELARRLMRTSSPGSAPVLSGAVAVAVAASDTRVTKVRRVVARWRRHGLDVYGLILLDVTPGKTLSSEAHINSERRGQR